MKFSNDDDVEKYEIEVSKIGQNYPLLTVDIMEQFSSRLYDVK